MPEVTIEQTFESDLANVFAIVFGPKAFFKFHEAEKHFDNRIVADWHDDGNGGLGRNLHYILPANPVLRLPDITVHSRETATKLKNGGWEIVGKATNTGSSLAEATQCTVTYTLTPRAAGGVHVNCHVVYTFELSSLPWLLQKTIEVALHRDMREGHRRFLDTCKEFDHRDMDVPQAFADFGKVPALDYRSEENRSFASCHGSGASFAEGKGFYTPIQTPTTQGETPNLNDLRELSLDGDFNNSPTHERDAASAHAPSRAHTVVNIDSAQKKASGFVSTRQRAGAPSYEATPPPPPPAASRSSSPSRARGFSLTQRYNKIVLLVLALSLSWCLGHLSALPATQPMPAPLPSTAAQ